jgi:hypothetical protein
MTTQQTLNLEALKLLKDWGVWMVTVQTAVIAFLGTGIRAVGIPPTGAVIAIIFFSSSIIIAAWLLAGIPYIVIQLEEKPDTNIYYERIITISILRRFSLHIWSTILHWLFVLGIASLVVSLLYSLML